MRKLLFDFGNTRIKYSWLDGEEKLHPSKVIDEKDIKEFLFSNVDNVLIASVGQPSGVTKVNRICQELQIKCSEIKTQPEAFRIKTPYENVQTLGVDRWLVALAVATRSDKATAIIDAGTAVTCEFVHNREYLGGWIAPGFSLMRDSLVNNTQGVFANTQFPNDLVIGTNTEDCVNQGCLAMVKGFVREAEFLLSSLSKDYEIIVSGGAAVLLDTDQNNSITIEQDLVFKGLKLFL